MGDRSTHTNRIWVVAITSIVLIFSGCSRNGGMLPPKFAGVWTVDDPRYHDRLLELSPAFVIVVTGPADPPSVQMIDKVEIQQMGQEEALTIYSTDHDIDNHYELSFTFTPDNGGEIRFKNQSQVWRRQVDSRN